MHPQDTDEPDSPHVLVVDDDLALTSTLARVLGAEGFDVSVASNGAEGLERVRAQCPALVIVDAQMPIMDGYAFIDAFRASPDCGETPIILATGTDEVGPARQHLQGQGVVLLMPKPFDLEPLLLAVNALARAQRTHA
jgi:CheY-like chemotaxis protein